MAEEVSTLSQQDHDASRGGTEFRRSLLLVAQTALLGEVSSAIRGVTIGWNSKTITLRAVVDGPVEDEDAESMEFVGGEIIASFPDHSIDVETIRVDAPIALAPYLLEVWVYYRKEREPSDE